MYRAVILTEKNKQAALAAKVLGGKPQDGGKFWVTSDNVAIVNAIGHLINPLYPKDIDPKYKVWSLETLPFVFDELKLAPIESKKGQLSVVGKLLKNTSEVIIAADKEREGELIAVELLEYFGFKGVRKRALFTALTPKEFSRAFNPANIIDAAETYPMALEAKARQWADYTIGLNCTMGISAANKKILPKDKFLTAGRVQSVILHIIVERYLKNKNFTPDDIYSLSANCFSDGVKFKMKWAAKPEVKSLFDYSDPNYNSKEAKRIIESVRDRVSSDSLVITDRSEQQKNEKHPLGFNLAKLQQEMGKRYKYSLKQTLDIAQSLYEKGLTTYPRTDSRHMEEILFGERASTLNNLSKMDFTTEMRGLIAGCDISIKSPTWDDEKVSDHGAIIPTDMSYNISSLSDQERIVYETIVRSYLAQFYPVHKYNQTKLVGVSAGESFSVTGKVTTDIGWRTVYKSQKDLNDDGSDKKDESSKALPNLNKGDLISKVDYVVASDKSKPPALFTESTLSAEMESAHKYIQDKKLKDFFRKSKVDGSIGRPATQAAHVENLFNRDYCKREGKKKLIVPTEWGMALWEVTPPELKKPEMTAYWETLLDKIVKGEVSVGAFKQSQMRSLERIMLHINSDECKIKNIPHKYKCAKCSGPLISQKGKFGKYFKCYNESCGATFPDKNGRPGEATKEREKSNCGVCGGVAIRLESKFDNGHYWQCEMFFDKKKPCKSRFADNNGKVGALLEQNSAKQSSEFKCDKCKDGSFIQRKSGKTGNVFWGCSAFPKCKNLKNDNNGRPEGF